MSEVAPFVISRTFDAPRDLVWEVWTTPEHMGKWFGPKGFDGRAVSMDFRPGGLYHYSLKSPDGMEMWGRFIYREISKPERISLINSFSDPAGGIARHPMSPTWPRELLTIFEFTESNGKTTVTVNWSPHNATAEEIATFEAGRGSMNQGWTGTFERCTEYLATLVGGKR